MMLVLATAAVAASDPHSMANSQGTAEQARTGGVKPPSLIDHGCPAEREEAGQLLNEAIAMHRQIGMRKQQEMAEALSEP